MTSEAELPTENTTVEARPSHSGTWHTAHREPIEPTPPPGSWRHYEALQLPPVLRHSLDAFAEHGYHGTSVREIAQRLGQTVPAIYYHYENKQALLVTLLQGSMEEVLQRCRLAVAEADGDGVEQFRALVACVALYVTNRQSLIKIDVEMRSLERQNRRVYVALRDELEDMVVNAIRDGVGRGSFQTRFPRDAARAVLSMLLGIATWYDPSQPMAPDDVAEQYLEFALGTVGAVPDR